MHWFTVVDSEFTSVNENDDTPVWPEKYTVKTRKISLTANLIEEFLFWLVFYILYKTLWHALYFDFGSDIC